MLKIFFKQFAIFVVICSLFFSLTNEVFAYNYTIAATYTPTKYTSAATYTPTKYTSAATYTANTSEYHSLYNSYVAEDWLSCGFVGCKTTYVYTPTYTYNKCTSSCCGSSCPKPYQPPVKKCSDSCSVSGQRQCSGKGYRICERGSDGCLEWSNVINCGSGTCVNDSCLSSCTNDCSVSGQRQCSGNGFQQCGNFDSDNCLEWGAVVNCNAGDKCNNGSCVNEPSQPICTNECDVKDQRVCSGNGWKQCGNYDSDSCLEWGAVADCTANETCVNGSCIYHPTCSDQCVTGSHQCSGSSGSTCGIFSGACASWGAYQQCDPQCFRCGDDRCDCGETQSSCPQDCGYDRPTVNLRSRGSVSCGKEAILTWDSTNADSCTASGAWSGSKRTNGSETVGDFTGTKTFKITCRNEGGTASDSVTLTGSDDDLEVSAGSDKEVCDMNSVILNGSVEGDYDRLSWSCTGGSLSDSDVKNPSWRPDVYRKSNYNYDGYGYEYEQNDGTYTCTLTARNECGSDSDSMVIRVRRQNEPATYGAYTIEPAIAAPAAVYVYEPAVHYATQVSTGFDNNMLAGLGISAAGILVALYFLAKHLLAKKKPTSEEKLARRINFIKRNKLA